VAADKGFLHAIIENPQDDTPRLIYADWLEEHGDPGRAEFIRVQCELARTDEADERSTLLRERAWELLRQHGRGWREELQAWAQGASPWFRRGFVAGIATTARQFLSSGKGLCGRTPLESVRLRDPRERLNELAQCASLSRLSELVLDLLSGTRTRLDLDGLRVLLASPHLGRLQSLDLSGSGLGPRGAEVLAESPAVANLSMLSLVGAEVNSAAIEWLAASPARERCSILRLRANEVSGWGAAALARFTSLRVLTLGLNPLGGEGVGALAGSPHLTSLAWLDLDQTRPGRDGIAALASSPHLRNLRRLSLEANGLDDEAVELLLTSPHLHRLTHLDLYNNRITDRGVALLAGSSRLGSLRELSLGFNPISAQGAAVLAGAAWLKQLSYLRLDYTRIGEEGRALLRDQLGGSRCLEDSPSSWLPMFTNLRGAGGMG
jgi:uncharacterized protein (TIGR02996 family)